MEYRKRYVKVFEDDKKTSGGLAIVAIRPNGSLFWNFIPANPKSLNRNHHGALLHPK